MNCKFAHCAPQGPRSGQASESVTYILFFFKQSKMDEIKNLWSDVRGPYVADYSKQTLFDPKVNKRYNAKYYYQVDADCCF